MAAAPVTTTVKTARPSGRARRRRANALRDVRQGLLVDAAKTVFSAVGLEGATMRAIAAEAGCTTGAIYPYFRGKEDLYAAVLSRSLTALGTCVAASAGKSSSASDRARAALQAFFDYYRANPEELTLGLYLFGGIRPAGLNGKLNRALNKQLRDVFDLIEAAFEQAGEADPAGRTAAGVAQATGLLILERTGRIRLFKKTASELFANFLDSI